MKKFRFGTIHADYLTLAETIQEIGKLIEAKQGGFVVTPNVDHVVQAETNTALRKAYETASLSLVDGMPLKWMSRILGHPLPEKVSGSDLIRPLMAHAAAHNCNVYLLGSAPGIGQQAAEKLQEENKGLQIVGIDSPPFGFEKDAEVEEQVMQRVIDAKPDIVLFALGCPKQELLMAKWYERLAPSVLLGIGASLDFIAGHVKRSPKWMSNMGIEWVYRICQDPKRLAKRYLVQDSAIFSIFLRMLRTPREDRVFFE